MYEYRLPDELDVCQLTDQFRNGGMDLARRHEFAWRM